jgi:2-dehydro-3-deoxygluconokinase
MSARILGLGEALLRLSPPGRERLGQARQLDVHVGGAELNALIAAAAMGAEATWVTRLADNPLGRRIAAHAMARDVWNVIGWDADARAPLYFVEHGAAPRPSEVLYDRDGTAMRALTENEHDWSELVEGQDVVLASGITCALGAGPAAAVTALLSAAHDARVRTAFDVNFRARLWSWEQAAPVLRHALAHVDVLVAGRHDLEALVGAQDEPVALAERAIAAFGHELVILRETTAVPGRGVRVGVTAVGAHGAVSSPEYEAEVVDAFGAGDAALAALLVAEHDGAGLEAAIDRAAWAAAFQHTTPGDDWQGRSADLEQRALSRRVLR